MNGFVGLFPQRKVKRDENILSERESNSLPGSDDRVAGQGVPIGNGVYVYNVQ